MLTKYKILTALSLTYFLSACELNIVKEYHSNGNLSFECPYKDSLRHGKCIWYYEDGTIEQEIDYQNGVIHGDFIVYYANGKIKSMATFSSGLKNGIAKDFYQDGQLKIEQKYLDNLSHGVFNSYYANGKKRMIAELSADTTIYYIVNDSILDKVIKEYRKVEVLQKTRDYYIGDTVKLDFLLSGPVISDSVHAKLFLFKGAVNEPDEFIFSNHSDFETLIHKMKGSLSIPMNELGSYKVVLKIPNVINDSLPAYEGDECFVVIER